MRPRRVPRRRRRVESVEPAPPDQTTRVVEEEAVPPPPRDRIWPWLLLLLLLVLGGLAALWFFTRDTGPDKTTVPRVIGMTEPLARARLQERQLTADVDRRPSRRARGVVFAQSPGAGKQVNEDSRVELLVSTGPAGVLVPKVIGLKEVPAAARLGAKGLKPKVRRAFAQKPKGIVVGQNPRQGTRVVRRTVVVITVSKGPKLVVVPDVVGQDQRDAVAALRKVDLLANIFQVPAPDPKGAVVAQNPAAGRKVQAGTKVRLNVSTGQAGTQTATTATTRTTTTARGTARVPAVVGLAQTRALRRLQATGFRGSVRYVRSSKPAGTVIAQRPAEGTSAPRNSVVTLSISTGRNPRPQKTVPDVTGEDEQTATQTLRQAGFRVEAIAQPTDDQTEDGIVVDQQPAGGSRAPEGATVTIFVGQFSG